MSHERTAIEYNLLAEHFHRELQRADAAEAEIARLRTLLAEARQAMIDAGHGPHADEECAACVWLASTRTEPEPRA